MFDTPDLKTIDPMHNPYTDIKMFNPSRIIPVIEQGIKVEKLNLEANKLIGNEMEVINIKHRIADAQILLLILSGDLKL